MANIFDCHNEPCKTTPWTIKLMLELGGGGGGGGGLEPRSARIYVFTVRVGYNSLHAEQLNSYKQNLFSYLTLYRTPPLQHKIDAYVRWGKRNEPEKIQKEP